jgi:hypothetical protein
MMKPICVLTLGAFFVGCHLDKLVSGSGGPHPTSTAPPVALVFMAQPKNAQVGQQITPVQVSVVDSAGVPVAGAETTTVVVTLGANPGGGKLLGDTSAHPTRGVATFSNLSIDKAGSGYTLIARVTGLPDTTSTSFDIKPAPPTTGSITVTTSTTGLDLDLNGYTVTVDGTNSQSIPTNSGSTGVTFPGLSVGNHGVVLSSVASNCSVTGGPSQTASVTAGQTTPIAFSVTCTAIPPTTGSLTVTTSTSGSDLDPDGYTVAVDQGAGQSITTNNSTGVTFTNLSAGNHSVVLTGVAGNCTVSGGTTHTVAVTAGGNTPTAFVVTCTATTGGLTVTTSTGGSDLDPDGYTVSVDGANQAIGTNATVTFTALTPGGHSVALSGVAANCSVSGANPRTVTVAAGSTASTTFSVTCTAIPPTTGDLVVTTTTGGSDLDPDGYTVSAGGTSKAILTNGSVTFSGLPAGANSVALSGIASNCTVSGANPLSANVPAGGTGHADFSISCVAPVNHAPVVNAGTDPQTVLIGALFTLSGASFSDQDNDGPWTVTIDWGDGTAPTTFPMPSQGTINGQHSYGDVLLASHTLTITVTDAHGATGRASKTVNVVAL